MRHKGTIKGKIVAALPGTTMMVRLIQKQRFLRCERSYGAPSPKTSPRNGACCLESCLRTSAWACARTHAPPLSAFLQSVLFTSGMVRICMTTTTRSQKISIKLLNVSSVSACSSALNFRCQVIWKYEVLECQGCRK